MKPHHSNADNEMSGRPARVARARHDADWLQVTVRSAETAAAERTKAASNTSRSGPGSRTERGTLSALLQAPTRAVEIPLEQIPALVAELASEQAALSALQGVLSARLLLTPA